MAFSKTFLLLALAFAVVLVISSEVSARELAETTQTQETNVEQSNYGGHGCYGHHCGCHGYHCGCHGHHCGHPAGETQEAETKGGEN